jgi:ABC-2 type transport system ATP-binding protein
VDTALELKGLTKVFGKVWAVDEIDLNVPRGAMYGIIEPSGAGKTTAIRMIMSILFPDSGTLSVLGHGSALDAKDRIGYLPGGARCVPQNARPRVPHFPCPVERRPRQ